MATFISLMQNVMVATFLRGGNFRPIAPRPGEEQIAAWANFIAGNLQLILLAFLVLCAVTLAASIGLLLRRNWARLLFVALLVVAIVWNVVGAVLMVLFFTAITQRIPAGVAPPEGFQTFAVIAGAMNVLFVFGFLALFGWIAKRLLSAEVRKEFARATAASHSE